MTPLERLAQWLPSHHPNYTVADVALSPTKGYLQCTKPCPVAGRSWLCGSHEHYHTISIEGVGYARRDERGRWVSPYRLWNELHGVLERRG